MALTPEEEALRSKLENMQDLISAPTQFKVGFLFPIFCCWSKVTFLTGPFE